MFANGVFLNGSRRHGLAMHRNGIIHRQFYSDRGETGTGWGPCAVSWGLGREKELRALN